MKNTSNTKIIYSLCIEDVQTVAIQEIERVLTAEEIDKIEDSIASKINWYDVIAGAIQDKI